MRARRKEGGPIANGWTAWKLESFGIYRGIYDRGPFWPSGATEVLEQERREGRGKETLGLGQRAARYQSIGEEECDSPSNRRVDKFLSTWKNATLKRLKREDKHMPTITLLTQIQMSWPPFSFSGLRIPPTAVVDGSLFCLHCHNETCSRTSGWRCTHLPIPYPFSRPDPFNLLRQSQHEPGGRRPGRK